MAKRRSAPHATRAASLAAACAALPVLTILLFAPGSTAAAPACTAAEAQTAAPRGMKVEAIDDLNPSLPKVPTGALLVRAEGDRPAYCLVTGSVVTNPITGKTANFGLALPLEWNQKFLFSGCGGLCGVVFQTPPGDTRGGGFPPDALARGYAIAATDDGHASDPVGMVLDGTWAIAGPGVANDEAVTDFYHRAVHVVTVAGKELVQRWYDRPLVRSYFFGCSGGGREAMVEATRYPSDYDGYVAGDPFFDVPGQILAGRAAKALLDAPDAFIPPALLTVVDTAVHASCDATDGVKDGLIQNPGKCALDPWSLRCEAGDEGDCLTKGQIDTLIAWFSAARDRRGRVVSFGFPMSDLYNDGAPGANLFRWTEAAGPPRERDAPDPWGPDKTKQAAGWAFYDQTFKYLVFLDPKRDNNDASPVDRYGIVEGVALARLEARTAAGRGDDPQKLGPFLSSGRKLIVFHGYSDGFINPFRTIDFYQDWAERTGGYEALGKSARLFMVPGMYHCEMGPGPNFFDALGALEQWVEYGRAPENILATKYQDDDHTKPRLRTMPLCPFPTQARYSGSGDVNEASSWSCAANEDLLQVGPAGARAGLATPAR